MTEHIQDQLSAFIDDELSEEETAFLVRRLERDAAARGQLARYALIGAALKGELLQPHPWVLQQRIAAALDGAPAIAPRAAAKRRGHRLAASRPLIGAGIAAAVAVAAIGLLRYTGEPDVPQIAQSGFTTLGAPARWSEPESYVVPQDSDFAPPIQLPIRLTNYLVNHGEYASHLSRTSVHSNVVGVIGAQLPSSEPAVVVPISAEGTQR